MASAFETLVARLTKDASRAQPRDALQWCSNWFQQRLEEQRARSRGDLARLPSYRASIPNDLFEDAPIRSNRKLMEGPAAVTASRYPCAPPRHLPSPPNFRGPSPFGILNAPGNTLLEGDTEDLLAPPPISDIECTPPIESMLSSGLYSTYQNTSPSPVPDQSSPSRSKDNLLSLSSPIPARRTPVSAEFIVINNESTEILPVFPEINDQPRRIRNSIASNFIFRNPDEEQETGEHNAMQEGRLEAEEAVVRQRDAEPLPSPWISGKPSTTSLPSEGKLLQPGPPPVQSPSSPSGPLTFSPTANSFIDPQLLHGVSFGFNSPQISSVKTTFKGGVPNVISLPTGRFVPFRIQAPDWGHLLKMMAQLSGTRVEASVETMTDTNQELKLRTVVQFVRVNTTSQDWRTILYLTIDNPPPSNASNKYTNGDVNTLPFSYSASSLPTLLRDGSDALMSKYYTIPATPNTPYPTLPISFPNLAMYLASAVEDSRRMAQDNWSGIKRLAKTLDTLYPAEFGMEDDVGDESDRPAGGVMGALRNVFGKTKKDQRRNDDSYKDLVTPFVPEWG